MSQLLNAGALEELNRFVLAANLDLNGEDGDPHADDHYSIYFSPVAWSLLLKGRETSHPTRKWSSTSKATVMSPRWLASTAWAT